MFKINIKLRSFAPPISTWKRKTLKNYQILTIVIMLNQMVECVHRRRMPSQIKGHNTRLSWFSLVLWLIDWFFGVLMPTFSNISATTWRPALVVEEAGVHGDPGQATGKLYHLRLRVECTLFCNLQSWARTHAVLVIGRWI